VVLKERETKKKQREGEKERIGRNDGLNKRGWGRGKLATFGGGNHNLETGKKRPGGGQGNLARTFPCGATTRGSVRKCEFAR